jgi:hypothetical protein
VFPGLGCSKASNVVCCCCAAVGWRCCCCCRWSTPVLLLLLLTDVAVAAEAAGQSPLLLQLLLCSCCCCWLAMLLLLLPADVAVALLLAGHQLHGDKSNHSSKAGMFGVGPGPLCVSVQCCNRDVGALVSAFRLWVCG